MRRSKSRSKSSELRDRLSDLPDSLILHILSLLPTSDAVRTTLLSKRWEGLWTTVPCLIFDAENKSSEKFRNLVNRAMLRWKGTKLQKFSLNFVMNCRSLAGDVDAWLHFAIEKGVEELCMDLRRDVYSPPQRLYSCSTIRKASLVHCLNIKGKVQWGQLTSLSIELDLLGEDVIEKILSGAPQMEILNLSYSYCNEVLNIQSESLKRLKVERNMDAEDEVFFNPLISTVKIWTPNVETLEISGIPYFNYSLMNVSSLTSAKVGFINTFFAHIDVHRVLKEKLKEMLEHFFPIIPHFEKVTLSAWFVKVLREIKQVNKHMVAPLSNVKFLVLYATHIYDVVDVLDIFPALTALVLLQELGTHKDPYFFEIACPSLMTCIPESDAEKSSEPKSNILMPYLKTVEITWAVDDHSMYPLIEILLNNVRELEKMVLRVTGLDSAVEAGALLLASQSLLRVQKAFPAADVILCAN